jgi:1-acyl-sn-glycerol-3-phosphate acyltransferase
MVGRPLMTRLWNIETEGFERLPDDGPAILCPNHISFIDSPFLMMMAPRNISFVGKAEYMDSWKTKYVFPALGMIPIDRSGGASAKGALEAAEEVLRRGELFGIFPEGTRTRDGTLRKGRTGAARLAMTVGCPIFPVGITGTDEIQAPGSSAPIPFRSCKISIGRAIHPERYSARDSDRLAWRSMTDEVMFEIREMTGQNYVNSYAGQKAETEPTVEAHVGTVTDAPPAAPGESPERSDEMVGVG